MRGHFELVAGETIRRVHVRRRNDTEALCHGVVLKHDRESDPFQTLMAQVTCMHCRRILLQQATFELAQLEDVRNGYG